MVVASAGPFVVVVVVVVAVVAVLARTSAANGERVEGVVVGARLLSYGETFSFPGEGTRISFATNDSNARKVPDRGKTTSLRVVGEGEQNGNCGCSEGVVSSCIFLTSRRKLTRAGIQNNKLIHYLAIINKKNVILSADA